VVIDFFERELKVISEAYAESGEKNRQCEELILVIRKTLDIMNSNTKKIRKLKKQLDEKCDKCIERNRTEAIKEFAEKLKEKSWIGMWDIVGHVDVDDIDNLVKEMVGNEGGEKK
jgi:hypothetical protein